MSSIEYSFSKPENQEIITIELTKEQWKSLVQPNSLIGAFPANTNKAEIVDALEVGFELASALGMVESMEQKLNRILLPQQNELLINYFNEGKTVEFKVRDW